MNELRYISLDQVVDDVILEQQMDARDKARLMGLCVRGFYYISRTAESEIKSVVLDWTNTDLRLIDFPIDYIEYRKVGVIVPRARGGCAVMTLSVNDSLKLIQQADIVAAECDCDNADSCSSNSALISQGYNPFDYGMLFRNVVRGNQYVGELFGYGGGESSWGSFREDKANQRFVFSSEVNTARGIVLEYKANLLANKSRTIVPWEMREVLISWINWKQLNKRNSNISEREEAKNNFWDAYNDYYNHETSMTKSEIIDKLYRSLNFTR